MVCNRVNITLSEKPSPNSAVGTAARGCRGACGSQNNSLVPIPKFRLRQFRCAVPRLKLIDRRVVRGTGCMRSAIRSCRAQPQSCARATFHANPARCEPYPFSSLFQQVRGCVATQLRMCRDSKETSYNRYYVKYGVELPSVTRKQRWHNGSSPLTSR